MKNLNSSFIYEQREKSDWHGRDEVCSERKLNVPTSGVLIAGKFLLEAVIPTGRTMMTQALLDVESMVRRRVFASLSERWWWTFKRWTASELIKTTLREAP